MDHDTLMNRTTRDSLADLPQLMSMLTIGKWHSIMVRRQPVTVFQVISPSFMTTTKAPSLSGVAFLPLYLKYPTEMRGADRSGDIRIRNFASLVVTHGSPTDLCRGKGESSELL